MLSLCIALYAAYLVTAFPTLDTQHESRIDLARHRFDISDEPVTSPSGLEPRKGSNVTIDSTYLNFNNECPNDRKKLIEKAWEDAIMLAKSVGSVKWDEPADIDFFGPPQRNSKLTAAPLTFSQHRNIFSCNYSLCRMH